MPFDMHKSPPHVLLWSPVGSGQHYHGPATFTYRLFRDRDRDDLRLSLAHGYPDQAELDLFEKQFLIQSSRMSLISSVGFTYLGASWLKRHAREFDIILAVNDFHSSVRPAYEAAKQGVPVVLFVTASSAGFADKKGWKSWLALPRRRRRMAKQFDAVVALSSQIEQELIGYGFDEDCIFRIPNFADTERFHPNASPEAKLELRGRLGLEDRFTVVFSGRLCRRKRPHLLVEAIRILQDRGVDAQVILAGPNGEVEYMERLEQTIAKLGVTDRVIMTGFPSDPYDKEKYTQIEEWLRVSDVFSLPSSMEGMPAALVEGLACGLPGVVTDFSGAVDVVCDDEFGRVVEPTGGSLADAFEEYATNPSMLQASAVACRNHIVDRFSAAAVYRQYLEMFRSVTSKSS